MVCRLMDLDRMRVGGIEWNRRDATQGAANSSTVRCWRKDVLILSKKRVIYVCLAQRTDRTRPGPRPKLTGEVAVENGGAELGAVYLCGGWPWAKTRSAARRVFSGGPGLSAHPLGRH